MNVTYIERSPGTWRLRIEHGRDKLGKRLFRYETIRGAEDDAQKRRWEIMSAHEQGTFALPEKITVAGYFGSAQDVAADAPFEQRLSFWVRTRLALGKIRRSTAENYQTILDCHVVPRLGSMRLQKVTGPDIQALYTHLLTAPGVRRAASLDRNSVAHIHRILAVAFRSIRKSKLIKSNPMEEVDTPTAAKPKPKALEEVAVTERLLPALAGHWTEEPALVALGSGLRRGELLGLRWRDVDLSRGRVHVQGQLVEYNDGSTEWTPPKTEAGNRKVSLPTEIADLLRRRRRVVAEQRMRLGLGGAGLDDAYVFTVDGVQPIRPSTFTKAFTAVCRKNGLPEFTFHGTRHTHITALLQRVGKQGAKAVSERAGHSDIMVTLGTYQAVFESDDRELADLASGMFGGGRK
jgi:integrase